MTSSRWQRNPYIIGIPIKEPQLFFGREELFDFITDNLSSKAKVILLYGQRRIGKSSVLHQIPNLVHLEEFIFVQFDLQDQTWQSLSSILNDLAVDISDSLNTSLGCELVPPSAKELEENPDVFSTVFLPQVYKALRGKSLVLLLDEFDALGDAEGAAVSPFVSFLQSIIYRQDKLFIIPVLGRRLKEVPVLIGLFRQAPNKEIGLLDVNSATKLITEPARGVLEYSHETIQAILALSSGHPYFTQLLCHVIFARMREEGRDTVTPADVEEIVDKAIESGEAGLAWFRDGLPVAERVVFSAIAEVQETLAQAPETLFSTPISRGLASSLIKKPTSFTTASPDNPSIVGPLWSALKQYGITQTEQLRKAEERLIRWGYLRELTRSGPREFKTLTIFTERYSYDVKIELVRRWLLKRHPLREAMRDLEQIDADANLAYERAVAARRQTEPPSKEEMLKQYEDVLKANPNHFSALFDAAEIALELKLFEQAAELYARAHCVNQIRAREGYVESLLGHTHELMERREFEPAREKFEELLEVEPNEPLALEGLKEAENRIRTAKAVLNPFVVSGAVPPDQFVGREREVDTLFSHILHGSNVAVYGERRIGKTSLLRYVASPDTWLKHGFDSSRALIVNIDCQAVIPFSPVYFWREMLLEIEEKVEGDQELLEITNRLLQAERFSVRELRRLTQALHSRNRLLVLIADEFELALQPNDSYSEKDMIAFLYELRSLSSMDGGLLPIVVATHRKLNEFTPSTPASPWSNVFSHLPLRPFDEKEASALVAKMPEEFAPSDQELAWVRQVAGGCPYLLQSSLSILFRLHAEGKDFDIKQTTQEMATATDPFFKTIWNGATNVERLLMTLIASTRCEALNSKTHPAPLNGYVFTHCQRELRDLEERGLVKRVEADGNAHYRLISSLMEWWIIKEIEARHADEKEETQLFSILPSEYTGQLQRVFEEIRTNQLAFRRIEVWVQPTKGVENSGTA